MDTTVMTSGVKEVNYLRTPNDFSVARESGVVEWFIQDDQSDTILRRFCVVLTSEDDGGFSVEAPQLPGVFSQGESENEAIANIKEAALAMLDSFHEDNSEIPWLKDIPQVDETQRLLWIALDVQAS